MNSTTSLSGARRDHRFAFQGVVTALAVLMIGWVGSAQAQEHLGPCDILALAKTPCVAAHSMTRALYGKYSGPLYQVKRGDGQVQDIATLGPGGVANAKAQDAFCAGAVCIVTRIYDQSPQRNDLTIEGGGENGAPDHGAVANALPITVEGRRAYGLFIEAGMGYRDDNTHGVAQNGEPETMVMVTSGLHVNKGCCFDYGNAERNNRDTGNGHMDALNFSLTCGQRKVCLGSGPWVQADLENGLYLSGRERDTASAYKGNRSAFVTALLKNNGRDFFALKSADAQHGSFKLIYSGNEPLWKPGYSPMHQEGAIVLGTGGDNSNQSVGSFFEGVMTQGVSTPQADAAVQANIVAARYAE